MIVSQQNIDQFHQEGFFVLEGLISDEPLEGLRTECMRYVANFDAEMEAKGLDRLGISQYKKRYFISNRGHESPTITAFLFGDMMVEIVRAALGGTAYLFNEQYVVKAPDRQTQFAWHQDSGYIGHYHKPYLSCWCALDDMSEQNGTIYVLPYRRAGMQPDDLFEHIVDPETNDKIGYHGSDPGIPVVAPAGTVVVFSSRTFHRSGANLSSRIRRSYLAQYSMEPIMSKDRSKVWAQAVPLLVNGERIAPHV